MEYKILRHGDGGTLIGLVNGAIAEGWRPQGGVGGAGTEGHMTFAQAMVKD